ncbi:unnamed protein product, partial [Acanthocheilonema viteae]
KGMSLVVINCQYIQFGGGSFKNFTFGSNGGRSDHTVGSYVDLFNSCSIPVQVCFMEAFDC